MRKMVIFLTSIFCIFKFIFNASNDCFTDTRPTNKEDCSKRNAGKNFYCCYVDFRTDKNPNYQKLCVDVIEADIKDGMFEQTIKSIEAGSYNSSGWSRHEMAYFSNYASINEFDCKSNYLTVSLLLLSLFIL